jgi:hypothetical protein
MAHWERLSGRYGTLEKTMPGLSVVGIGYMTGELPRKRKIDLYILYPEWAISGMGYAIGK